MTHQRARRRNQRGSSLVEGALVTLGFLAMLLGIMGFSRAVFAYNQMQYVAQEGTRYASVRGSSTGGNAATTTSVSNYVKGLMIAIDSSQATVTTSWSPNNNPGGTVTVQVDYNFSATMIPFVPASMTLRGVSKSVVLQ